MSRLASVMNKKTNNTIIKKSGRLSESVVTYYQESKKVRIISVLERHIPKACCAR